MNSIRRVYAVLLVVIVFLATLSYIIFSNYMLAQTRNMIESRAKILANATASQSVLNLILEDEEALSVQLSNLIQNHVITAGVFYDPQGNKIVGKNLHLIPNLSHSNDEEMVVSWQKDSNNEPVLLASKKVFNPENGEHVGSVLIAVPTREYQAQKSVTTNITILVLILYTLFGTTAYFVATKKLLNPIDHLRNIFKQVADGNLDINLQTERSDEVGELYRAFDFMIEKRKEHLENLKQKQTEAEEAQTAAVELKNQILEEQQYLERQFQRISETIRAVVNGDLTVQLEVERNDAVGELIQNINAMIRDLRNILGEVQHVSNSVAEASTTIAASASQMSQGANEQAQQTSEVAAAVEEMTRTIHESSNHVKEAAHMAEKASSLAQKGEQVFRDTLTGMQKIANVVKKAAQTVETLGKSSMEIGEIIQVINDIADQTNLLALNAAIEAARAGEQGRGFAVVADEVRNLAERTSSATKEISEMIQRIQEETNQVVVSMSEGNKEVENGMLLADQAKTALNEIIKSVNHINTMIERIASASEEQSDASSQISSNIEEIAEVARNVSMATEQLAETSMRLNQLTDNLKSIILKFHIDQSQPQYSAVSFSTS